MPTRKSTTKKQNSPPKKIVITDPEALRIIHAEAIIIGKTWAQTAASLLIRQDAVRSATASNT